MVFRGTLHLDQALVDEFWVRFRGTIIKVEDLVCVRIVRRALHRLVVFRCDLELLIASVVLSVELVLRMSLHGQLRWEVASDQR